MSLEEYIEHLEFRLKIAEEERQKILEHLFKVEAELKEIKDAR